jgi:hypothetical protein
MASSLGPQCSHKAPSACSRSQPASATGQLAFGSKDERVQLEVEATEGKGISAAQAIAAAKIHHSPIHNPPALQDFLSNKLYVSVLVFRRNSPLRTSTHTWSRQMVSHRKSYKLLTDADTSFWSRLGPYHQHGRTGLLLSVQAASARPPSVREAELYCASYSYSQQ